MSAVTRRNLDITSLVAGLAIAAFGTLLLLDRTDVLDLRFGYFWPALTATVGAILLASGLSRGRR
jgi:cell wall-active antibiotic response 4TMS protein YvqF